MKKSIFKNAIFKFLLNLFNVIIPILIGPYVVRVLGPDYMGTINFSQSIFSYFFIFASFGVYQYGLREISRVRDDSEKLSSVFTSLFLFTLLTNILTTIIYVIFVQAKYANSDIYYATIMLTFNFISNVFYIEWVNEALENYSFITTKTIVVKIIYIVLLFVMVRSKNDFNNYIYLILLSTFLNNIISYVFIRRKVKFNFKNLRVFRHFKPLFMVVILSNANMLFTQLDRIMLGEYINKVSVAYYVMAQNIMQIINTLMLTVIHVTLPRLSNYLAKDSDEDYTVLLNKISKIYFLVVFPASIGMYVISKEIILLYGGADYIDAYPILSVFSLYMISLAYEAIISNQIMYIKKREKQQVIMVFICGIINLIFNIVLIKLNIFNGTTAIATTTIANILFIFMEYIYVKKVIKVDFKIFSLDKQKYLWISLIFIPVTWLIRKFITRTIFIALATVGVNGLLYIAILILIKDKVLMDFYNKIFAKIKKR